MTQTHRKKNKRLSGSFFTSVKALVSSGFALIFLGSMLLLTFSVATTNIKQQQDLQGQASVPEGGVSLSYHAFPSQPETNSPTTINLNLEPGSTKVQEITLLFDVITDVTDSIIAEGSSANFDFQVKQEQVDHGFKVNVIATPKNPAGFATSDASEPFFKISYTPTKNGSVSLNFDREMSRAIAFGSDPPKDELTHVPLIVVNVGDTNGQATVTYQDDLFLLTDSPDNYFSFFETTGSRNQVSKDALIKDRTYTIRHLARIQNLNDDQTFATDPVLTAKLKINDTETVTRTFLRSTLKRQTEPLELQLETTFKAKESNSFAIVIDSTNSFPEINENNNGFSISYGTSTAVKACNEVCDSNADCADSQRCYDTGSDKRCRLVTNLTSTSCTAPASPERACNQYCADTNECAEGYTCWYNSCRNPYNVESTSCVNPSDRTLELIRENCNVSCDTNRDCANNMRCFNGSCRLATNPSSTSCSAATVATLSKGYVKATPQPTTSPKPTATSSPTASTTATPTPTPIATAAPTPTPTSEPESAQESVLDSIFGWMTDLFQSDNPVSRLVFSSALIPIAIIGAGVLLLIVALVVVLRPGRKMMDLDLVEAKSSTRPTPEFHTKPNPPPPPIPSFGTILPTEKSDTNMAAAKPEMVEEPPTLSPTESKPEPAVSTQTEQIRIEAAQGSQTMLERLKAKGVQTPTGSSAQKTTQTDQSDQGESPTQPTPSSDTAWPEDEMVR